jgi:hypothetical protein
MHQVCGAKVADNGAEPVNLPDGWNVSPYDYDSARICMSYHWQSMFLVFDDGTAVGTGMSYALAGQLWCYAVVVRLVTSRIRETTESQLEKQLALSARWAVCTAQECGCSAEETCIKLSH